MRLHVETLRGWVSPTNAFIALYSTLSNSFWIDREHSSTARYSVIGTGEAVTFSSIADLSNFLENYEDIELPFDFRPGLVGWLDFEQLNPRFMRVESAMVFDHEQKHIYLIAKTDSESKFKGWLDAALLRIGLIGGESLKFLQETLEPAIHSVTPFHSDQEYLKLIERAQENISAGNVYQLCLTNKYQIEGHANPLATFISLREINPAPYAGYFRFGETYLVSSSPEQFVQVNPAGMVSTKPIKGTRPRGSTPEIDKSIAEELANNEKERAENLMIVDLMRNDLTKVCEPNSVTVENLFDVESYATVHQLVSTVQGRLIQENSAVDVLEAAFPGGSMTGAPKLKAIELIASLEKVPRGIYSGIAGYLGDNGSADFGMNIRSLIFDHKEISLGVGGGITIDSNPAAELEETKLKAAALLRSLKAQQFLG